MRTDKDFLKRRLEDSIFYFRLLKKYSEKEPQESLSATLSEEYKKIYMNLLDEYVCHFDDSSERTDCAWKDKGV